MHNEGNPQSLSWALLPTSKTQQGPSTAALSRSSAGLSVVLTPSYMLPDPFSHLSVLVHPLATSPLPPCVSSGSFQTLGCTFHLVL